MEAFSLDGGPPEYQQVRPLLQTVLFASGLSWLANYFIVIRAAFRGNPPGVSMIPLCNNLAWELVYALIYCPPHFANKVVFRSWLFVNVFVIYSMVRSAQGLKSDSLFLPRYTSFFVVVGITWFFSGHWSLAVYLGPTRALYWGGMISQVIVAVGELGVLIQRGHTRGLSYARWLSRFIGAVLAMASVYIRSYSWSEEWGWSDNVMMTWLVASSVVLDIVYGFCFWFTRRVEQHERLGMKKG